MVVHSNNCVTRLKLDADRKPKNFRSAGSLSHCHLFDTCSVENLVPLSKCVLRTLGSSDLAYPLNKDGCKISRSSQKNCVTRKSLVSESAAAKKAIKCGTVGSKTADFFIELCGIQKTFCNGVCLL